MPTTAKSQETLARQVEGWAFEVAQWAHHHLRSPVVLEIDHYSILERISLQLDGQTVTCQARSESAVFAAFTAAAPSLEQTLRVGEPWSPVTLTALLLRWLAGRLSVVRGQAGIELGHLISKGGDLVSQLAQRRG
jgi:hypothetical protein